MRPASPRSETRWRRNALLPVSLVLLLLIQVSQTASPNTQELFDAATTATAATSTAAGDGGSGSLLDSLWSSFKQTLESTRNSQSTKRRTSTTESSSSSSRTSWRSTAQPTHQQQQHQHQQEYPTEALPAKRIQLMELTLQEHYTRQLVESSPYLDEHYLAATTTTTTTTSSSTTLDEVVVDEQQPWRPIRWTSERSCLGFTASKTAYWSFQWCPGETVSQGVRINNINNNNEFESHHRLGRYTRWSKNERWGETVFNFFRVSLSKYNPKETEHQVFTMGEKCAERRFRRRIAMVITHEYGSTMCEHEFLSSASSASASASASALQQNESVITMVEEPQTCKYILHVCKPSPLVATATNTEQEEEEEATRRPTQEQQERLQQQQPPITESDAMELNRTMQNIHEVMHAYLHQTEASSYRKSNPDRTSHLHAGLPPLPASKVNNNLHLIQDMFMHAYDSYMYNAYPASEVKPVSCKPSMFSLVKIPALTLIDSLDTLIILGNYTEFARSVERLRSLDAYLAEQNFKLAKGGLFALNQNVSVFETNIRVLGGLLSAHQLAEAYVEDKLVRQTDVLDKEGKIPIGALGTTATDVCPNENKKDSQSCSAETLYECQQDEEEESSSSIPCHTNQTVEYWEYDGLLLELAIDIADRLLPAFQTRTGIPYGTVNLLSGIPKDETPIASLAGGGTLSIEMELLSRLTGNQEYGRAAKLAVRALWMRRSQLNMFGKHICTSRGEWTESLSGIGSNSDSFYEYLVKHYVVFPDDHDFWYQTLSAYGGIHNESRLGEWYGDVDVQRGVSSGGGAKRTFEALMAFYPGMQVLLGELTPAARSLNSFFLVREHLGFLPERFSYAFWKIDPAGGKHLLRPEILESAYFMHRATKGFQQQSRRRKSSSLISSSSSSSSQDSSGWQWAADFALQRLDKVTRTECGFASIDDVSPVHTGSVHLAHDSKSKLLFDEMPSYFLSETLKYLYLTFDEDNVLHTDQDRDWIFTTEAHPVHFVEKEENNKKSQLKDKKEQLIRRLKLRMYLSEKSESSSWAELDNERWSLDSSLESFKSQIEQFKEHVETTTTSPPTAPRAKDENMFRALLEPFLEEGQVSADLDFFNETQTGWNAAHLSYQKMGNKDMPPRSCNNFYASDLLWIRALNGGFTDYADAYISSAQDHVVSGESQFLMLGSVDALALQGSGIYAAPLYDDTLRCPIRDNVRREHKPEKHTAMATKEQQQQQRQATDNNMDAKERFDMGGELGQFDVSAFSGGSGFFIQRVETGESIITTLIDDGSDTDRIETYVMVYANMPIDSETEHAAAASVKITARGIHKWEPTDQPERSVVMSDFNGNNFVCKIEIFESCVPEDDDDDDDDWGSLEEKEKLVATLPCAPGLFGPTHLSNLVITNGLSVKASLIPPVAGDEHGCKGGGDEPFPTTSDFMPMKIKAEDVPLSDAVPTTAQDAASPGAETEDNIEEDGGTDDDTYKTCKNSVVQIVRRGVCTFQEKSLNQLKGVNAEAVIVINSDANELFVMSGGGVEDTHVDDEDYPATVLITGDDGQVLTDLIELNALQGCAQLTARVTLSPDKIEIVEEEDGKSFSVVGNTYWPALRVTSQVVQLFAKGGWGVHAVRSEKAKGAELEWQLYVMSHKLTP
jgi:mannosidase alpha-like ER degradation enhancer 2